MKKKGFTLVELLAVIVILAIIALIAIPLIGNVIEKAKIGALESSVNGLVESANMYYANNTIKGETISETTFDFEDGEQVSDKKLEYKGKVYNGKLILHSNGEVAVCIDDEEHYAYKNKDTDEIASGNGTCLYDGTTGDFSSNSPVEDLKQQIAAATATSDKVLEGNTIYTSVGLVAGTMTNKAGTTTVATTVTKSGTNALITIPTTGYYDTSSKISVPMSELNNSNYKILQLWSNTNSSVTKTITVQTSGTIFIYLSNRSDGNLTNNVNINSQFSVKKNNTAVALTLIDDNMTQFNDGAGTRIALATINVNAGDSISLTSSVWAAFTYMNRCYLSVPTNFSYT